MTHPCHRVAAVLIVLAVPPACTAGEAQLEGYWLGKLKVGVIQLRLGLNFSKDKQGQVTGTLDSIDQGAKDIKINEIAVKGADVTLKWTDKLKAEFTGQFEKDGKALAGKWNQSGLAFDLTFERQDRKPELTRPQEPKKPYPYQAEEITFENKKAGVKLAGTLTLPRGPGPHPAAVLLSGSGPQDRDETMLSHRPFLVLADYLTRRGIAVLRYDDRGVGGSTGDTLNSTLRDNAGDAMAAVNFLKGRADIDGRRIGLIGHSEGGLTGPLAATLSDDVAFVVMLAGTGLPGEDVLYLQGRRVIESSGGSAEHVKRTRALQEKLFAVIKNEPDDARARERVQKVLADFKAGLSEEEQKEYGGQQPLIEAQLKLIFTPWFRDFLRYDPAAALRQLRVPVLALVGERDVQVPPRENLAAIEKALKAGGNRDYTVKELPKLNHLFQTASTGAVSEYSQIEETIAPAALELIADWIRQRTKK